MAQMMPAQLAPQKLETFVGKAVADIGAAMSAALVLIGDRLDFYKTLHRTSPLSSERLATISRANRHARTCSRSGRRCTRNVRHRRCERLTRSRSRPRSAVRRDTRMREVVSEAGFGRFRRAAATPFNLIYEIQK
jgi:hypothetical protein